MVTEEKKRGGKNDPTSKNDLRAYFDGNRRHVASFLKVGRGGGQLHPKNPDKEK